LGLASSTEYLSRGDWLQTASQFGTLRNSSYALDVSYRSENGERPNNDFQQLTTGLTLKQQLSPKDSVLLQAGYYDANGGDVNQYYDPRVANRGLRVEETQEPYALAGYHRAWLPGVHTLFLAGRIHDRLEVANPQQETLLFQRDAAGAMTAALPFSIEQHYRSTLELYTVELQHVVQHEGMSWLAGGRFQSGEFDTRNVHTNADVAVAELDDFTEGILEDSIDASQATNRRNFNPAMQRWAAYSYLYVRPVEPLLLVGGLTYDDLTWPQNHRYAPLSDDEDGTRRLSPKAGLIWTPTRHTTVRGVYARALGGVSLDQSYQLEPTQVAGFVQTYRSLIPESVEGANAAATFETWGLSLEENFAGRTYVGLTGEVLGSAVQRTIGAYNQDENFITTVSQTAKELDYEERNLGLTFNQLMGAEWSMGARYRLSRARLEGRFEEIGASVTLIGGLPQRTEEEATLHQTTLFVLFNHASGFYSQGQARWNRQETDGMPSNVHDEDVWQFDVWAGWRFFGRRLELTAGVLNLTDRDYRLHPLNLTAQLPRERTFFTRLRFHF
jgi:outer membrane receptor protein involved in Fe transport